MSIQSDHKVLIFLGAIAVLGAGVRVARAVGGPDARQAQPALDRQMQAADSAKRAVGGKRRSKKPAAPEPGRVAAIGPPAAQARVGRKLDLDVATAAQVDSLPGMSPTLAKRIVADRLLHGPFLSLGRLRRVSGVGPKLLQQIDTLVVFSGTMPSPNPADTIIPPANRRRAKK